jgi:hypothetical protein
MDRAIGGILQVKQTVSNTEMPRLSLVRQPTPNLKWLVLRKPLSYNCHVPQNQS